MYLPTRSSFLISPSSQHFHADEPGLVPGKWLVSAAVSSLIVLIAMMAWEHLRIDPLAVAPMAFASIAALLVTTAYVYRRPANRVQRIARDISEYFGLFTLIALIGATATYPLSAGSHGFVDPALQQIDALLRFNWIAWYDVVAAHRSLQLLGTAAYQSIFVSPAILLGYFAWTGHRASARGFITAFWLAAVLSLSLFPFLPAEGPLAFLWRGPIPYMPESALYQMSLIPELRRHDISHVDLGALRGLVSAPSFHTASAILYVATAWPFRTLRWPLVVINVAMLLSIPVEGTHYLTDMIAGALVAVAALGVVAEVRFRLAACEPAA
ncbi:MAG: phosphatase PAP2 family protein [Sphingomonas sp.]